MHTNIEPVIPSDTTGLLLLPGVHGLRLLIVAAVILPTAAFSSRKSRREACLKALKEPPGSCLLRCVRPTSRQSPIGSVTVPRA